jgi:RHS repeat-associated protein
LVYARFKTAGGGIKEESLSYDAFGNLLSSVSTDYGSRSWSVDGVNRLAGCGYDAAGRMTACGGLTLSWTAAGELGKVQGTGINRSFLYTASGEKVMVRNELLGTAAVSLRDLGGNPVRHYLYSGGSWSWLGDDIYLGRQRIAQVTSSGTRYFHVDHLGSVRRVSTGAGALEKAYDFFPYGLPVKETVGQERLWFGGYELEHQNTSVYTDDLYFLHARWYFPSMGRFLSPDPVRGDPAQPQSLNLYSYVRGNPLNAVDPDGRITLDAYQAAQAASEQEYYDASGERRAFFGTGDWLASRGMLWYAMPQEAPGGGGGAAAQANQAAASEAATQQKQVELLARLLYAEAGGEGTEGMQAVAAVVMNRVASPNFPDTVEKVILQKGQFEAVKSRLWKDFDKPTTAQERAVVEEARRIACQAVEGRIAETPGGFRVGGATYFAAFQKQNDYGLPRGFFQKAVASGRLIFVDQVGNHIFLAPAAGR